MLLTPAFVAALAVHAADAPAAPDPCAGLSARIQQSALPAHARRDVEAYRAAWRRVCDPAAGPADLAALLGDAEALTADVMLEESVAQILRSVPDDAPSPLPGIRHSGAGPAVDRDAFQAVLERGRAEDQRFWRGAARALDRAGRPVWLETSPDGEPACVRLGEVAWAEIAAGLELMETAGAEPYVRSGRALRTSLVETLSGVATAPVCGCTRGDPLAGLEPLAASGEKRGTPMQRAVVQAARDALDALRAGRARVRWLRDAPGAPATGCRPGGP
jgi:hypothetical protein